MRLCVRCLESHLKKQFSFQSHIERSGVGENLKAIKRAMFGCTLIYMPRSSSNKLFMDSSGNR